MRSIDSKSLMYFISQKGIVLVMRFPKYCSLTVDTGIERNVIMPKKKK